jgi:hypothetical protein
MISDEDKQDIEILKEARKRIGHADVIDKVIYETYYRSCYNTLMVHLGLNGDKKSGIYKITDKITGQSYIGQSVNLQDRFKQHIKAGLSSAPATNKLYQAMKKDGLYNFTFEILEEVPKDKLNERETYYIELYQTKVEGLNKTIGGA